MPVQSSADDAMAAAQALIHALLYPAHATPIATIKNQQRNALTQLAHIFANVTSPSLSPQVLPLQLPPNNAAPLARVDTPLTHAQKLPPLPTAPRLPLAPGPPPLPLLPGSTKCFPCAHNATANTAVAATNRPSGPEGCPMSEGGASNTNSHILTSTTNLCHCCHGQCQAPPSPRHQSITAPTRLSSSTAPPHHMPTRFPTPLPRSDPWHHPLRCHVLSLCHQQQSSPYHSSAA